MTLPSVRVGLTLPSFVRDPGEVLEVARVAEEAGLDGVFVYDHLFRFSKEGRRRPALESTALLGALTVATNEITIGVLVARAWIRPPATLAAGLETVQRIAGGRLVAGIGAGDAESREEDEAFGLGAATPGARVERLRAAVVAARDRGFPVWVGGRGPRVREIASEVADGWNAWGATHDTFEQQAAAVRSAAVRAPFEASWGGLTVLDGDDVAAQAKAVRLVAPPFALVGGPERVAAGLRSMVDAGSAWVIVAPVDSRDPANARRLGTEVLPRLR